MEQTTPKYFAFISYSSADKAWAIRLQKKLEQYRLPTRLQKKYRDVSRRAYPICRDDTDISGFKVWDALTDLLDDSKYLIVICSPRSAKSEWVNKEIQYFIDHGKENQIMPFIVEGVPHSGDPETECFPPAILNMREDPLGVDVTALGKRKAYLRAVSTLLGVEFEELLMRDTVRRVRNGVCQGVAAVAAVAALCSGIWYNTEHSKYYSAVAYRNEIPVGIYPLSKEERAHRAESYKITTQRGRVIRLERVNSMDVPSQQMITPVTSDYPCLNYQYNEAGELIAIIQKDETGVEVTRKLVTAVEDTNQVFIDFVSPSEKTAQALSADMSRGLVGDTQLDAKSEITRYQNTYDEEGRLLRTVFQRNNLGEPSCDSNGVYGKAYEYNEQGLITCISNLDQAGNLFDCKYGWAYEKLFYNEQGNEILAYYYDSLGNRAIGKDGNSGTSVAYDGYGNITLWSNLNTDGALTILKEGYAAIALTYSEQGLCTSVCYLGANLEPVYSSDLIHEVRYEYDGLGRMICQSFYDTQGKPTYSPTVYCSQKKIKWNRKGQLAEIQMLDAEGNPTPSRVNYAFGFRYSYDKANRLDRHVFLNMNWLPMKVVYLERDRVGRVVSERIVSSTAIENLEIAYDVFGNIVSVRFLDEDGAPCNCDEGYSIREMTYEAGKETSQRFLNTEGEPTVCNEHYHEVRKEYDGKGNCIRKSFYGTDKTLVNLADGYAVITQEYDTHGNVTQTRYYNAELEPVCDKASGVYGTRYTYDGRGNCVRTEYLNEQGGLMIGPKGYAVLVSQWDDLGRACREERRDVHDHLVRGEDNWAAAEYEYDNLGNVTQERYYDENDQPCFHSGDYFMVKRTYAAGKITYEAYYNADSKRVLKDNLFHACRMEYNEMGDCMSQSFLDTAGRPVNGQCWIARNESEDDATARLIHTLMGSAGDVPENKDIFYRHLTEFDDQTHFIYGLYQRKRTAKSAINSVEKPSVAIYERNLWGRCTQEKRLYERPGAPTLLVTTNLKYENSRLIVHRQIGHLAADGTACMDSEERFAYHSSVDDFSVRMNYLDDSGNPQVGKGGISNVTALYSPQEKLMALEYYDVTGLPCLYNGNVFRLEADRDADGNLTEIRCYDENRQPCKENTGVAAISRYTLDTQGVITDAWFYNEYNAPLHGETSHVQYVWDDAGYIGREKHYNGNGEQTGEMVRCAFVTETVPGYPVADAGIDPGDDRVYLILQLGAWNCFGEHTSSMGELYTEAARTASAENVLVLCAITEDGLDIRKCDLPATTAGIQIDDCLMDANDLENIQRAYEQWLSQQP